MKEQIAGRESDDSVLLERYRCGDDDALGIVYRRHARALVFYSRTLIGDQSQAEDLAQDAFLRILDCDPGQIRISVKALLYATVRHLSIDLMRKATVRSRNKAEVSKENVSMQTRPDDAEKVFHALDQLPQEQREVVILKIYSGFTFEESASLLGVPAPTVTSRYRYALQKLAHMLSRERGEE